MNRRVVKLFLVTGLFLPSLASAQSNRGWRCMSKTVGHCEQGVFNDIERLTHPNFKSLSNKYGLTLKAIRVGERLVTGYLEGQLQIGDRKFPNQILEITFDPGADIDGTSIPSLGISRYSIGDGDVDDKGQSLWATSNLNSSTVRGFYADLVRESFTRAVRQALGLDAPVAQPPTSTPQTCWRGCSKDSEERRFHEITVLANGIMSARSRLATTLPLKLSCVFYRPNGTYELPEKPHYEASGRFDKTFDIQYVSNLKPRALELFTDSALTVLEGQIHIAGQANQVQFSSSYYAGQPVEGSLIPGFGGSWKPVTGPDTTTFWERSEFDIIVRDAIPVFHEEEAGGKYPREVHCFEPGKEPGFAYWEKPVEYNKLNYREKRTLPKDIQPIMEKVQANILSSFAFAVKVHSKQAKLTPEELSAYRNGYFAKTLSDLTSNLQRSFDSANALIKSARKAESDLTPILDESRQALDAKKSSADQLISLKDRLIKATQSSCNGNLNPFSDALTNLTQDFDAFLQFNSDAGTIFAVADGTADFENIFSAVKPPIESVERTLGDLESILETDGTCQKLTKALSGVTLKLDSQFLEGDLDTLAKISKSALDALKKTAALKEVSALDLRLTGKFEQLAMEFNSGIADLSYSQILDTLDAVSAFLNQDAKVEADSLMIAEIAQKNALKEKFSLRRDSLTSEFQQFLQDADGPLGLIKMRESYHYAAMIDRIRQNLKSLPDAQQKAFLASWVRKFLDNGYDLSSSCLDPKIAIGAQSPCWSLPLPAASASIEELASFDRKLTDIIKHAKQTLGE